jgi:hypothetical protein
MTGMFEQSEVTADLAQRLTAAGLDPADPNVAAISAVVSAYFAERTAEVLARVRDVLDQVKKEDLN